MPTYKVAHIHEQGQDMIIFPLGSQFGRMTSSDQDAELNTLGFRANAAGLKGAAVAVWDNGGGRMGFFGPQQWHQFLRSINLRFVLANVNKEISW
jgi:hypothetical protein